VSPGAGADNRLVQHLFHVAPGAAEAVEVELGRLSEVRSAGGWLWLDITEFSVDEVHQVGREFGFDPLAVEDVLDWSQHPKVEDHAGYTFVVGHGLSVAASSNRLRTTEYNVFVADNYLVTFHRKIYRGSSGAGST
jgi:Mg2+ and Co2+ transporter CorA